MAMVSLLAEGHPDQMFGPSREKIDLRLERQLLSVVSRKRGEAMTQTINTLVAKRFAEYGSTVSGYTLISKKPSPLDNEILQIAAANLEQLSPWIQNILRNYRKANGLENPSP
jgi:hypothetical protein